MSSLVKNEREIDHSPQTFICEVECSLMSFPVALHQAFKRSIHILFSFFEEHLYEKPLNLVIFSVGILLSINMYFSIFQIIKGGFIETDMWFFAYRINEIADEGLQSLFITPYGIIDVHPPLYYVVTVLLKKAGLSVLSVAAILRIIIPVTVTYLVYKTGDLLFGKQAAAVACFFVALMPPSGSYHGLWTSTPCAMSLIPFLLGVYVFVRFSEFQKMRWLFLSVILFLAASLTHILTAFASFIFLGCALFFFRKKIPRLFVLTMITILVIISAYGWLFFSSTAGSTSLLDLLQNAFSHPSPQKASSLRQFFFIAYWPRHLTLITSVGFFAAVFHFYSRKAPLRTIDSVFFAWMILLAVYSQLFLVGIYLANQRFLLYLLFPISIYGGYGFTKEVMPVLRKDTFLKFSFFASILLFSVYQTGIALAYYPTTIRSGDVRSLEEMNEILPEGTIYVQNWFHSGRYLFAYTTGRKDIIWDMSLNRQIGLPSDDIRSVLAYSGVDYLVVVSEARASVYMNALGDGITCIWTDGRFYLLEVHI